MEMGQSEGRGDDLRRDFRGEVCGRAEPPSLPPWEGTESHRFASDPVAKASRAPGRGYPGLPLQSTTVAPSNHSSRRSFPQVCTLGQAQTGQFVSAPHAAPSTMIRSPGWRADAGGELGGQLGCWPKDVVLLAWPPGLPHLVGWVPTGEGKLPFLLEDRHR